MSYDPVPNGIVHKTRNRVEAQFSVDIDPMRLHCADAYLQLPCSLFARHTTGQQPHYFTLAMGQFLRFPLHPRFYRRGAGQISAQYQLRQSPRKKMPLDRKSVV